jgi:uncharacterized damage-inducible protein DinB
MDFWMGDMETEYFRRLFRYDRWANGEVLASMQAAKEPPEKALRWLAHLAGAGHTWLARVRGEECPLAIWPELTLEQCASYLEKLGDGWLVSLDELGATGLNRIAVYRNSKGEEFSTAVPDILTQVLTHGAYHRGQIAAEMRAHGETPAMTDFIIAVRKGVLEG